MNTQRHPVNRIALAAAVICLLVFLRALACDFVGLDDGDYILKNTDIRHLDARLLVSAFTRLFAGDYWMPLTWLSFAVDYRFWGLNPLGYHLTNILLHAANAGLAVLIADRLCRDRFGRPGAFAGYRYLYPGMLLLAGLLFGIHPLRVESVAWVTERKDVLNGLFALGSILCYLDYAHAREDGGGTGTARWYYLLSLVLFVLSLMAKPVSVVIPALLLAADWCPLGRLRKGRILPVLAEKIPFFVGSAAMAAAIILIMSGQNSIASGADLPFGLRVIVSGNAVFEYARLQLFPVGILPFYVLAKAIPPAFAVKTAVVVAVTCLCIYAGRRRPWVCATWFSFVIPLLPVLAFFYNGVDIAFAARFTYLPAVVPSIVAAALCAVAYERVARGGQRAAHAAAELPRGTLDCLGHPDYLCPQFLRVERTGLRLQFAAICNNVGRTGGGDGADVGRRLRVDPQQLHDQSRVARSVRKRAGAGKLVLGVPWREGSSDVYYSFGARIYMDGDRRREVWHSGYDVRVGQSSTMRLLDNGLWIVVLANSGLDASGQPWAGTVARIVDGCLAEPSTRCVASRESSP